MDKFIPAYPEGSNDPDARQDREKWTCIKRMQ